MKGDTTSGTPRSVNLARDAARPGSGQFVSSRRTRSANVGSRPGAYETVEPATLGRLRLLQANGVGIDLDGRRVFVEGTAVTLPRKEFDLLRVLLENAGRALSRRELLDTVWGAGYVERNKTLDVHIRRLRRKLDPQSGSTHIRTVRGFGYVFDVDASHFT